jgi:hypothetical protein
MMNTALTPAMERMALLRKDSESEGSADAAGIKTFILTAYTHTTSILILIESMLGAEELRHIVTDAIDKVRYWLMALYDKMT